MSKQQASKSSVDEYLDELELDEAQESDDLAWLEEQASSFLAQPEVDETLQEILDATKAFTRKNFSLRAGLLYRQQLQNTPSYEVVQSLEAALIELAGEANRVAHAQANPDLAADKKQSIQHQHNKSIVEWAVEELMPALEGTEVVKITRSTKKPKNMLASCPPAILAKVGARYKSVLERAIDPKVVDQELGKSSAIIELREWMAAASGRSLPSEGIALAMLWSSKERKQWIHGLVEYAQALIELVAIAQELEPTLRPSKYLCYYQKRSESTLYRGQEELNAMIENMRADRLLPSLNADDELAEWEQSQASEADLYDNERDSAGWDEETVQELDQRFARHATGETNEALPPAVASSQSAPSLSLRDRLRAKRLASQKKDR